MFEDREDAGRQLGLKIKGSLKKDNYVVTAIARGGVVVGKFVADTLKVKLYAIVIRKIGAPYNRELAIGAIGPKGIVYWDEDLIKSLKINTSYRIDALKEKKKEVKNLEKKFSINKKGLDFRDKRVILIDDGIATGATVLCSQKCLKKQKAKEIILAVPVISRESFEDIKMFFDKTIVLKIADGFSAVGQFYKDFPQVGNKEVIEVLSN